jgi:CheY-like chemotaxis protein
MLTATKEARPSHVPLPCGAMVESRRSSIRVDSWGPNRRKPPPCVLVVESRDDAYGALRSLIEAQGLRVSRATRGGEVAARIRELAPQLVLIHEDMHDESGWLIAAKLQFSRCLGPVWLYTARWPRCLAVRQKATGVDQVIQCGRSLFALLEEVQTRIIEWRMTRPSPAVTSPLRFRSA